MDSAMARKKWELENNIVIGDELFHYDKAHQVNYQDEKVTKARHFKSVKISALALLKMVIHARSGGNLEVEGIMKGKIDGDSFVVMDVVPDSDETKTNTLPDGSDETKTNALLNGSDEYENDYTRCEQVVRFLNPKSLFFHF